MPASIGQLWQVASSGIYSQQRHLQIISNNIANVNSTGFKASQAGFQAVIRDAQLSEEEAALFITAQPGDTVQEGMGVLLTHTTPLFSQGTLQRTDDPLHLAINGAGFFQVMDADGTLLYTRSGDFRRDADGRLVNGLGQYLEPAVELPDTVTDVFVDETGRILGRAPDGAGQTQQFGTVQIATFPNVDGLEHVGGNAFAPTDASGPAQLGEPGAEGHGLLYSGFLEGSNVDLGREMVDLLRTQRTYSLSLRTLRLADEIYRMANEMPR